jgi:hypothetical protein
MPPKTPVRNVLGDVTNDAWPTNDDAWPVPIAKTGTVFKAGLTDNDHSRLVLLSKFEASEVIRAGKLAKLSRYNRWQKREFVLNSAGLLHYCSKNSMGGLIDLKEVLNIEVKGAHILFQMDGTTLIKLRAASKTDAIGWHTALMAFHSKGTVIEPPSPPVKLHPKMCKMVYQAAVCIQRHFRGSSLRHTIQLQRKKKCSSSSGKTAKNAEVIKQMAKTLESKGRLVAAGVTVQGESGWYKVNGSSNGSSKVAYFWRDPTQADRWRQETPIMTEAQWLELVEVAQSTGRLVPLQIKRNNTLAKIQKRGGVELMDRHGRLSFWCAEAYAEACASEDRVVCTLQKCLWRQCEGIKFTCVNNQRAHGHKDVGILTLVLDEHGVVDGSLRLKCQSAGPNVAMATGWVSTPEVRRGVADAMVAGATDTAVARVERVLKQQVQHHKQEMARGEKQQRQKGQLDLEHSAAMVLQSKVRQILAVAETNAQLMEQVQHEERRGAAVLLIQTTARLAMAQKRARKTAEKAAQEPREKVAAAPRKWKAPKTAGSLVSERVRQWEGLHTATA